MKLTLSSQIAILTTVAALLFTVCVARSAQKTSQGPPQLPPAPSGYQQFLPNAILTPGATLPVTTTDLCTPGYASKVRNVPEAVKAQVYARYGIAHHPKGAYEVDHLISLELGGSNALANLWPQSYNTYPWNAHIKDALENRLHAEVCSNKITLAQAQHDIATDWIALYRSTFDTVPYHPGPVPEHHRHKNVQ